MDASGENHQHSTSPQEESQTFVKNLESKPIKTQVSTEQVQETTELKDDLNVDQTTVKIVKTESDANVQQQEPVDNFARPKEIKMMDTITFVDGF